MSIRPLPSKGLLSTISFSGSGRMDYYLENNLKLESSFNRVAAMRNGKIVIELRLGSVEDLNQVRLSQSGVCSRTDAGNCDIEQSWDLEVSADYAERRTNSSQRDSAHHTLNVADGGGA